MLFKKFSENNILRLLSSGNSVFKFLKISESVLFAPKDDGAEPEYGKLDEVREFHMGDLGVIGWR